MAFRSLSKGGKMVAGLVFGGGAVGFVTFYAYPYNKHLYETLYHPGRASSTEAKKTEAAFAKLQQSDSESLLKKHLTQTLFDKLKSRRTKLHGTLYDVICSGAANTDAEIGVYATDKYSYAVFKDLFDPIIENYHGFSPNDKQPPVDLGQDKLDQLEPLDKEGKYIVSTRIRCGRSLEGFPMNTLMVEDDYLLIEHRLKQAFNTLGTEKGTGELKGTYYPLKGMDKNTQQTLVKEDSLFKDNDKHLQAAGAFHHWPKGRGIFHNDSKTFLAWVGEEDHLRLISVQKGGDVAAVLDRLNKAIMSLESQMEFSRDPRLGWVTYCPSNLGSAIRASVHIRLPKLSARKDFNELCAGLNLQVRSVHGERSKSKYGGVFDVSNKRCLGVTEFEAVKDMYDGVRQLIELERKA